MAEVTQLGYIGIGVKDIDAWEEYAQNVLGLQVSGKEEDGSLLLRMDAYHYRFILHPSGEDDLVFAGWETKDATTMAEIASQLRNAGVEVEEGSEDLVRSRSVLGLIRFKDPNGLETEVFYGPFFDNGNPFKSPRNITGFQTGEQGSMGLGHILIGVKNSKETSDFYTGLLGLKISDYIDLGPSGRPMRASFMHANPRHHSLAFVELPGAQKLINHFMIEAKEMDDVGLTFNLVKSKGIYTGELGRHTNDRMFSFYSMSPSNFMIEFGCNGRLVDDTDWQVQYYKAASIWGHDRPQAPSPVAPGAGGDRS
ncbi:MAG: VOC family protein [Dehalococcoidia bacterium]